MASPVVSLTCTFCFLWQLWAALIIRGSIVQFTVVQKLNQGERKKSVVYLFFLDFFCYFFVSRQKSK